MKRRWTRRWAGTLVLAALSACRAGEAAEDTPTIETAEVTRGDLTIQVEATGTVEPIRSVEVKSKASGEILQLHADVGDKVEAGTLLAEVDPRDVRNGFNQAKADLEVARARVDISKAQLERSQELLKAGVITEQEHESTRLDYANAQANLVKAETNYQLAELRLGDVTIRAPLDGTIIQKNVEEGQVIQSASQNVSGGTTLFVMANLDRMQVRTLVDETDMGQIQAGLSATVQVEAYPDRTFRGSVQKIEPQAVVVQNVTMFPVIVDLDNRAGLLKPGMNAEVTVLVDEARDVLLVPNSAIVQISDIGPAALALGMDVENLDLRSLMRAARGGARAGGSASGGPSASAGETRSGAEARRPGSASGPGAARGRTLPPAMDSLRAKVARGEISRDSMRILIQAMRANRNRAAGGGAAGGAGRAGGAQAGDGAAGTPGAAAARAGGGPGADAGAPPREARPAAVFVMSEEGIPELRMVRIGLNDWDNTQIVSGVQEGERLAVVSAAQLQAQQQEFLNRIRSRRGGSPFGGGGPRGGRRR